MWFIVNNTTELTILNPYYPPYGKISIFLGKCRPPPVYYLPNLLCRALRPLLGVENVWPQSMIHRLYDPEDKTEVSGNRTLSAELRNSSPNHYTTETFERFPFSDLKKKWREIF